MKTLSESGHVFNFAQHGAFDPDGKIQGQPSQAEIDAHNEAVAAQELATMREMGRGILYLRYVNGKLANVGSWDGSVRFSCSYRESRNNWGAQRTDVWFAIDGRKWHGVNLGDNNIVRCKRLKH